MSYYYAKFEENPCVGTDESTPFQVGLKSLLRQGLSNLNSMVAWCIN